MVEMGNLDTCLGVTLIYFIIAEMSNLLGKITNSMTIIVRVVGLMAGCF
jgi:hypothetical protein